MALVNVTAGDGVIRATVEHPPINLLDVGLITELARVVSRVEADDTCKVFVVDSAVEGFFLAHADVLMIKAIPVERHEQRPELNFFHQLTERIRLLPVFTVAIVEGCARGGGCEMAMNFDCRFAALETAVLGQPEVALGIIPGGSGTARLPSLVGYARAMELIAGCDDVDAATAERWGLVNRALPAAELRPFVDRLVQRVASFPRESVLAAKQAVGAGDLFVEADQFNRAWSTGEGIGRIDAFLAAGGQTVDGEHGIQRIIDSL